jgi:tetratricopeptide (TPR) repeat protein
MRKQSSSQLLPVLMLLIALVTVLITIGTQFTDIVWWPVLWSLPVLGVAALVIWAVQVRHLTDDGVTVRLTHRLALGTALIVAAAGTVGAWGVIRGAEERELDAARDRQRRAVAWVAEGKRLARDGAHADAIVALRSAIDLHPAEATLIDAYRERGRVHATRGENIAAVKDFSAALALYAEDRDSLFERAQSLLEIGQCHQAVADLRAIVYGTGVANALDPEYAPAYHNLAIGEAGLDRFDTAFEAIEEAIRLNDEHPGFRRVLGQVHAGRGDRAEAMEALSDAIELAGDEDEHRGDWEKAGEILDAVANAGDEPIDTFEPCA